MDVTKKELYTAKRSGGLQTDDPAISSASVNLRSTESSVNWMLLKIVNGNQLSLAGQGEGGVCELLANLSDDEVYFGAFHCQVGKMTKTFHIFFVGGSVPALRKGKASLHKNAALAVVEAHGEIAYNGDLSSFDENVIRQEIAKQMRCPVESIELH